jgi:hypothetical protein
MFFAVWDLDSKLSGLALARLCNYLVEYFLQRNLRVLSWLATLANALRSSAWQAFSTVWQTACVALGTRLVLGSVRGWSGSNEFPCFAQHSKRFALGELHLYFSRHLCSSPSGTYTCSFSQPAFAIVQTSAVRTQATEQEVSVFPLLRILNGKFPINFCLHGMPCSHSS